MDSGNSSSMQSSSCGNGDDQEYDSRPDSVLPAFLNTFNQHPTFFDSSQNYHHLNNNPFSQSQPLNFDALRPAGTDLDNLVLLQQQGSTMRSRPVHDQHQHEPSGAKNPKKRTRASRRAPTTVMTTDTTNFRAMVQEFTGIPAPPFSGSSYSGRLELFGSGYSESLGSSFYPLRRPSAKRLHTTTPLMNNHLLDANPSPSSNYQLSFQSLLDPPPLHPSIGLPGFGAKSHGGSCSTMHGHGSVGLNDGNNSNQDHFRDDFLVSGVHQHGSDVNDG